jgi:predicted alpha/beta hydrolase
MNAPGSPRFVRAPVATRTADGWTLRGESLVPAGPRAVAVLAHAMMVNRRTMDRPAGAGLASHLAAQDLAVFNFDLRGHGESGPTAREGAKWCYDDYILQDLPALVAEARARFPGLHVSVVGHSLGGHTALFAAALSPERAPDSIVAIAANMWLPSLEPSRARRIAKGLVVHAWLGVTMLGGRFDPRWLRAGTDAEPLPYVAQAARMYRRDRLGSVDDRFDYLEALETLRLPVLSVTSAGDRLLARPAAVARLLARAARAEITHRRVEHGEGGRRAPGHMELVTDAGSRPIWGEIAAYIRSRAA